MTTMFVSKLPGVRVLLLASTFAICLAAPRLHAADPAPPNTLSEAEKSAGWRLLWDGKTSNGWRSPKSESFPSKGWQIADGVLTVLPSGGGESSNGGDIISKDRFSEFDLMVDFKITEGANSGVKYFVQPNLKPIDKNTGKPVAVGSAIGLEFQILDDLRHPDAKLGRNGNRTIGSLYDMITAPSTKRVYPPGSWNNARILSDGKEITFTLNGVETLKIERGSDDWKKLVAISKYAKWGNFGELPEGHILLQDHGNTVAYRNIKIRDFSKK